MAFAKQTVLQRQVPNVRELFMRNAFDAGRIETLVPLIEHFEIRVPFIGAFSSGKSSLINALINEPLLATEITPETAVATEMRYGQERRFIGHLSGNKTIALTEAEVQQNQLAMLTPHGWLAVELPCETLAATPHLVLVDMPGWASGVAAHQQVVDDYAHRSLAYAVVVSVEEGTLRENVRSALSELAVQEKPVILIVAKAHKRPEEETAAVVRKLTDEITQLMQSPPFAVAITSAAKRDTAQLKQALERLESQAQNVFEESVVSPWRSELQRAGQLLQVLSSQHFKDAELISAEIEKFEQQMREFDQRLSHETEALEERIGPMLGAIQLRVENALAGRLDALTERALAGSNISDNILGTARLVVSQALKEEFEPAMLRYLDRLADALPSRLNFDLDFSRMQNAAQSPDGGEFRWKDLSVALAPLLVAVPHPFARIAAVVLPVIASLFDSKASRQRQEVEEALQRERARNQVRSALSEATAQIESQLASAMYEQVQKAKDTVTKNIATERADIEQALNTKRQALQEGEAQIAALREKALADLQEVEHWLAEVPQEKRQ